MIITNHNYQQQLEKVTQEDEKLSARFEEMLKLLNISKIPIAIVGNSIAAGYSKCDCIIPFPMRTKLYHSPCAQFATFARVRHNEDENIFTWYLENRTQKELGHLLIDDILVKKATYNDRTWNQETILQYERMMGDSIIGLRDFCELEHNVMIYHGFTGTFTDIVRKGSKDDWKKIFSCFQKDFEVAKITLSTIAMQNPHLQIYVCGLPNIGGTGIISALDGKIKKICSSFPNIIFVPGTIRNAFFPLEGQKQFDIHYSAPEYVLLWSNLIGAMLDHYLPVTFNTLVLEKLHEYHKVVEKESTISKGDRETVTKIIEDTIQQHQPFFTNTGQSIKACLDYCAAYYDNHYLTTFSCTPRDAVKQKLLLK